jgi:hypothetical protein
VCVCVCVYGWVLIECVCVYKYVQREREQLLGMARPVISVIITVVNTGVNTVVNTAVNTVVNTVVNTDVNTVRGISRKGSSGVLLGGRHLHELLQHLLRGLQPIRYVLFFFSGGVSVHTR